MRKALLFLFCSAFLFGAHDPRMTKLDSYFPFVLMDPTDTLHFRPDEYKPGTQDTALAAENEQLRAMLLDVEWLVDELLETTVRIARESLEISLELHAEDLGHHRDEVAEVA